MAKLEANVEEVIRTYPFVKYINEDKSHYKTATESVYNYPENLLRIGDS